MATVFIDSNVVGGTADGSTWANAYSTFGAALTAKNTTAPHDYYLAYDHAEGLNTTDSLSFDWQEGANTITSRDPADDSYRKGALVDNIGTGYFYLTGNGYVAGVTFKTNRALQVLNTAIPSPGHTLTFEDCKWWITRNSALDYMGAIGSTNNAGCLVTFRKCEFEFGSIYGMFRVTHAHRVIMIECAVVTNTIYYFIDSTTTDGVNLSIRNCDLNYAFDLVEDLNDVDGHAQNIEFIRCATGTEGSGLSLSNYPNTAAELVYRSLGQDGDYYKVQQLDGNRGFLRTDTAVVRIDGATYDGLPYANDGSNGMSFYIAPYSNVDTFIEPLILNLGNFTVDLSDSREISFFVLLDDNITPIAAYTNADLWINLEQPDPRNTAKGIELSTRVENITSTPVALPDVTHSWLYKDGGGATYMARKKITIATEQVKGLKNGEVTISLGCGKLVDTSFMYICPLPEIV